MNISGASRAVALIVFVVLACSRGRRAGTFPDGGNSVGSDGSIPDGGHDVPRARVCPAAPPVDSGIVWDAGVQAIRSQPQTGSWTQVSGDASCQSLSPPAPPSAQLTWLGPGDGVCDAPSINGDGDLAVYSLTGGSDGFTFATADGQRAAFAAFSKTEQLNVAAPLAHGFATVGHEFVSACDYSRLIDGAQHVSEPTLIDGPYGSQIYKVIANPQGGFVEERSVAGPSTVAHPNYLELRWVDDNLRPVGDWHTAVTWSGGAENAWTVIVDVTGRALVLSFMFLPSLGGSTDPSTWVFSARWMGTDGPASDAFSPVTPIYTSRDGRVYFADWDTIVPLREGGFAMYHPPLQGPGTLSQSGWYSYYPSGLAKVAPPPSWLNAYDGSMQLVARGAAYAAVQRDKQTCERTVSLISPSGVKCFQLPLEGSDLCGTNDTLQSDGTLIVRSGCALRWWPKVARVMQ